MKTSSRLTLRAVTPSDSADLLGWRNDPATRAHSRNTAVIAAKEHEAWLARALDDPNHRIWIAEQGGHKLGTVSAALVDGDRADGDRVEISITVSQERRGQGLGTEMIRAAVLGTVEVWPTAAIEAMIRADNAASRGAFERCGFTPADRDGEFLIYRLSP